MPTNTNTFNYTGTVKHITIPAGATSIDMYLWGGAGGGGEFAQFCGHGKVPGSFVTGLDECLLHGREGLFLLVHGVLQ